MSRREDIDNAIWSDPDFEALSANATLLYLWSFTNARCGMAGMYKVSPRAMVESKVPEAQIPEALAELRETRFAFYEDSVLWVRTRVKHLRSRSPQMAKSVVNDVLKLPGDHVLRARFTAEYESDVWLREELKRTYPEPMGNLSEKPIGKGDLHRSPIPSREGTGKGQGQDVVLNRPTTTVSSNDAQHVFDAWLESTGRTSRTLFDAKRKRVVERALKSYPLADLLDAVRGWRHSSHHRGENADGTVYNDLELLLRDAKNIEKFRDLERNPPTVNGRVNPDVPTYLRPSEEWKAQLDAHLEAQKERAT